MKIVHTRITFGDGEEGLPVFAFDPDSDKVASALYKRANVLLSMEESDKAIEDLKNIVVNYPDTSDSELAKGVLKKLGERIPRARR